MKLRISTVFSVILLLLSSCTCFNRCVHTDREETAVFEENRDSFELVNNYILENFGHLEKSNILLVRDDEEVICTLYNNGEYIELTGKLKRAFNTMGDVIRYNFNNIKVEKHRITYGGDTYRQYVYSRKHQVTFIMKVTK